MRKLDTDANEQSTFVVVAPFKDESGSSVTPNSGLTWSLFRLDGTTVNSRSNVAITPGSSVAIVLSDADLEIFTDDPVEEVYIHGIGMTTMQYGVRVLSVSGTYNSSAGNNLPIKDQVLFRVVNLIGIS